MISWRRLATALLLALAGCARAPVASSPSSSRAGAPEQQPAPPSPPPPPPAQASPPPDATSPAASAPATAGAAQRLPPRAEAMKKDAPPSSARPDALDGARRRLDEALALLTREDEHLTKLAGSACGDACRALASMERAARTVCELVPPEERSRCDDAVARLRGARRRVRDACGSCADGPSTDPDAPLR